jgi:hypothetical protein
MFRRRDMGKSAHGLPATTGYLRGGDVGRVGDDDDNDRQGRPGEWRAIAHSGSAVQEWTVRRPAA